MKTKWWNRQKLSALGLVVLMLVSACGGGGGGGDTGGSAPGGQSPSPAPAVTSDGGEVVASSDSRIRGATLSIPAQAITDGQVQFKLQDQEPPPGALPAAAAASTRFISPTVVITADRPGSLQSPATVTLPVNKAALTQGHPVVLAWNEEAGVYSPLNVTQVDAQAGVVRFLVQGAGRYIVASVGAGPQASAMALSDTSVQTGFTPERDGWYIENLGNAYGSQGGDCLGMVAYAQWYFERYRGDASKSGLYQDYRQGDRLSMHDDIDAIEIVDRLQTTPYQSQTTAIRRRYYPDPVPFPAALASHQLAFNDIVAQLMSTQKPVMLGVLTANAKDQSYENGHMILVYGYHADTRTFDIYDPNFPRRRQTLQFDPSRGFHGYTGDRRVDMAYPLSYNTLFSAAELQHLHDSVRVGLADSKRGSIDLTSPVTTRREGRNYAEIPANVDALIVSGKLSEFDDVEGEKVVGRAYPDDLSASFNGRRMGFLLESGTFSSSPGAIPSVREMLVAPGDVELILTAFNRGNIKGRFSLGGSKDRNLYGAFKRVTLVKGVRDLQGTWRVAATDRAGNNWAGSRMVVESQTVNGTDIGFSGYFYWTSTSGDHFGRENMRGTFSTVTGQFSAQGYELVPPTRNISTNVTYTGQLGPDGRSIRGNWRGSGSPSDDWSATLSTR